MSSDREMMREAIRVSLIGIRDGQSPFGAVIVKGGQVIARSHNTVRKDRDPTAHAEVNAIRAATQTLETADLSGCVLYSTCEPCPMCLAACSWAKLDRLVFGASVADAEREGFEQLPMVVRPEPAERKPRVKIEPAVMREECVALLVLGKKTSR